MSKALISFIDHLSINHKFYLRFQLSDGSYMSTCYWSGIYPNLDVNDIVKCAKLAEKLLCYDTCMITVDDYLFLAKVLETDVLNTLISDGAIEVYNNFGIKAAMAKMSENDPFILNFSFDNQFDPEAHVKDYQRIYHVNYDNVTEKHIMNVLTKTTSIDVDETWLNGLNKEITDDLGNKNITSELGLINDGKIIDRDHDYNQIIYNRIAYLNLYLALGNKLKIQDIVLPEEIQNLLDVKLGVYISNINNKISNSFSSIVEYTGVYDLFNMIISKQISFADILRIRNNKKSIDFRRWLEQTTQSNPSQDIINLYNNAVSEGVKLRVPNESALTKTLKFAIPKGISYIPFVGGVISSIIDTSLFAKDLVGSKYKPTIFIEDCLRNEIGIKMNEQMLRSENDYYKKLYGKISVNGNCPCGSGIKYKKCHGRSI